MAQPTRLAGDQRELTSKQDDYFLSENCLEGKQSSSGHVSTQ